MKSILCMSEDKGTYELSTDATPGEMNLDVLIQSMEPVLHNDTYVFATVDKAFNVDALQPLLVFREQEGIALILTQQSALNAEIPHDFPCRMITLNIHSSLDAVGFLARITTRLAALQMGVNPVSAFYHDHLFVPVDRAGDALAELKRMTQSQNG